MKLHIKNMVCDRCKMVVRTELEKLGFNPVMVDLGTVEITEPQLTASTGEKLQQQLLKVGFELLTDQKQQLVANIKAALIDLVHHQTTALKVNLSHHLSEKLKVNYASLSASFSETENMTIERYFILQKIEKVKELLSYGEKSLGEIAFQLNYSSVAHLSAQFKKVSGQTPSAYKSAQIKHRKTLDQI